MRDVTLPGLPTSRPKHTDPLKGFGGVGGAEGERFELFRRPLAQAAATAGVRLLAKGHAYDWVCLDSANASGLWVVLYFGGRVGADLPVATIRAGDTARVPRGLPIYARAASITGQSLADTGAGDLAFWMGTGTPPQLGREFRPGDAVHQFRTAVTSLAAGASQAILQASDFVRASGLPCFVRVSVHGGNMDETSTGADYPLELRLRWHDGTNEHHRTWLFPGRNTAIIGFQLPAAYVASANNWVLEAHNPTGSVGAKSAGVVGEVLAGAFGEFNRYPQEARRTPITGQNFALNMAMVRRDSTQSVTYLGVTNEATAGTWGYYAYDYIPTLLGGPNIARTQSNTVAAASAASVNYQINSDYFLFRGRYTSAPTAGGAAHYVRT